MQIKAIKRGDLIQLRSRGADLNLTSDMGNSPLFIAEEHDFKDMLVDPGPWTIYPRLWTLDPGPWTLDSGSNTLNSGP